MSHWRRGLAALALAAGFFSAEAQAPIDVRVALVIGNGAYPSAPLSNPANDARAMAEVLRNTGFTVFEVRDGTRSQMEEAVGRLRDALKGKSGVGMLYYAGHGLQLEWRNYMVPVDAALRSAADVPRQTVELQSVLDAFKAAGNRMNIIVLDACRDNPFSAAASGKGLAQMDAPPGTLLAYATAPGNVAEDGTAASANGLYTEHLLHELKERNAKIEDVFKRVRWQVRQQSEGRQVPWESTSLEDDFYFDPSVKVVRLTDSQRGRQTAQQLARENAEWGRIKDSTQPADLYAFLQKYPNGLLSEQAQFRLDQLQRPKIEAQVAANGIQPLASGADRFALGDEMVFDRIDGFTKVAMRVRKVVTRVDKGIVEINDGEEIYDQMGGQIATRYGRKDPPVIVAPAELSVGKRWRTAYQNTSPDGRKQDVFYDFKVTAFEEVTVPAGRFMAYRLDRTGEARSQDGFAVRSGTTWIDPTTMIWVKLTGMERLGGRITSHDSDELVSFKRAPRAK